MIPIFRVSFAFLCLAWSSALASTQPGATVQADRVAAHPDLRASTMLRGHIPGWAVSANDQGAVAPGTPLHLTFVLSRSPELQASFIKLLADQQDPTSPIYHQWLTPQQAGERYGPTQHDLDALRNWLGTQGFDAVEAGPSRMFINATAPAATVASALATSFHMFSASGKSRISATVDPSIPAAFASVVTSISGLADTDLRPMHHGQAMAQGAQLQQNGVQPQYTTGSTHYITPGDFATIFDLKPAYNAGITGAGQRVAIIGRSRVASTDITGFEANTGLAANVPNVIVPPTGADPGLTNDDDQFEATLDVQRVIGTAPAIQADLVITSVAGGGLYRAASYEVETVLDPVMNISFGSCEVNAGASLVSQWDALFSVAASEGISVFVSAGDAGAAGCDEQFSTPPAYQFPSINYLCASSYVTCVGGTEFAEGTNSSYWSVSNGAGLASAVGYIPEGAWNELSVGVPSLSYVVASGGGGASIYVAKPVWQTGIGVPADKARDVPDVSFPSSFHDAYYGCFAAGGGDCATGRFYYYYGTSAASPAMAGVTALLNQKTGGSQGNLNPLLYQLAAANPSAFHDVNPAAINGTFCSINTASICNNSTPSANLLTGGLAGYAITPGYDQATGLGSLDVANFLTAAAAVAKSTLSPTTLTVQGSASTISNTQTVIFTAVLSSKIAGTPTGTVLFYADGNALGAPVVIVSGTAVTAALPFSAAGSYLISAIYSGDGTYASSTAPGYQLTVTGLSSAVAVTISNTTIPVGSAQTVHVSVSSGSGTGTPTGVVRVNVSGPAFNTSFTVPLSNGAATTPPVSFSAVGNYIITASYRGDSVFSPSSGTGPSVTVERITSVIQLSVLSNSIGVGGAASYGVTVLGQSPTTPGPPTLVPAPTGSFQLYSNGVALGTPFSRNSQTISTIQSPYDVFSTVGTYSITATFAGDAYWAPSATVQPVNLTVLSFPATYDLEVASKALSFAAGTSANLNSDSISLLSQLGFVGTVTLSCSVAYTGTTSPAVLPTCSIPNSSISVNPGSLASTALVINSTARSSSIALNRGRFSGMRGMAEVSVCGLMLWVLPVRRRVWRAGALLMVFWVGAMGLSGCGGQHSGSTTPPVITPATTPGTYTVTITPSTATPGTAVAPVAISLTIL